MAFLENGLVNTNDKINELRSICSDTDVLNSARNILTCSNFMHLFPDHPERENTLLSIVQEFDRIIGKSLQQGSNSQINAVTGLITRLISTPAMRALAESAQINNLDFCAFYLQVIVQNRSS
jgi:hypothetical protein